MRLDKFLAEASIGTRKVVRNYVKDGKVTVNNRYIADPAAEIDENADVIKYFGDEVVHAGSKYYMFHKPGGCVTARKDANEKTVLDYFEDNNKNGLFPVGRLDKNTEGLILLTNDGDFNHRLMYPDKHVEKTYFFWAFGALDFEDQELLNTGIMISKDEPLAKAVRIQVEAEGMYLEHQASLSNENILTIRKKNNRQQVVSGYITITEGRKHQVKRMLKAVGCYVVYLKRVSIGGLMLDENLKRGQYRELTENELRILG